MNGRTRLVSYALGRRLGETSPHGTVASRYDLAGRRTRLTWPDGFFVDYDHLTTGEMTRIRENGATSGLGVIAVFGYDTLGRRTSLTRGNGTVTTYAYDAVSRLQTQTLDLAGTASDLTLGFAYNPAAQIVTGTRSNALYSYTGAAAGTTNTTVNGLNQPTLHGAAAPTHDARGNLASDGTNSYGYSSENLLTSIAYGTRTHALSYDPLMRLYHLTTSGSSSRSFVQDGTDEIVTLMNGNFLNRTVFGPRPGEALYITNGSWRIWYHADERGSIVAQSGEAGSAYSTAAFDEYGDHQSSIGWYGFAGGMWLPQRLFQFEARVYDPALGRFLQTDPIGYGDGMNMYAYVGGDPVNNVDPSGMMTCNSAESRIAQCWRDSDDPLPLFDAMLGNDPGGYFSLGSSGDNDSITVTGRRVTDTFSPH